MSESSKKIVTLDLLEGVKNYIDFKDGVAIKNIDVQGNTWKFYTTEDMSGDPIKVVNLPEEMFLDQVKTTFVAEFAWSDDTYPNSTNPNLEGKPVFVLAVKGDTSVNYSFVSLEALFVVYEGDTTSSAITEISEDNKISTTVRISEEAGNIATIKNDGVYVPETELEYATKEDIDNLFRVTATPDVDEEGVD